MTRIFPEKTLQEALYAEQKGHVLGIRLSDGLLKARVKDKSGQIFDVHMDLKTWPSKPANCSCRKIHCPHVATSLYALQKKENLPLEAHPSMENPHAKDSGLGQVLLPPEQSHYRLIYLIEMDFNRTEEAAIFVRLAMAKPMKRKGLGAKVALNTFKMLHARAEQFFQDEDEEIFKALLLKSNKFAYQDKLSIRSSNLLEKILLSERAYLYHLEEDALLHYGPSLEAKPYWQLALDGTQNLFWQNTKGERLLPFYLDKAWYYNGEAQSMGRFEAPFSEKQLKALFSQRAFPIANSGLVVAELKQNFPGLVLPHSSEESLRQTLKPKPVLQFFACPWQDKKADKTKPRDYIFTALILFDYAGLRISEDEEQASLFAIQAQGLVEIARDFAFEQLAKEACSAILPRRLASLQEKLALLTEDLKGQVLLHYQKEEDLGRLHKELVPQLQAQGWIVEFHHAIYAEQVFMDDLDWSAQLSDQGQDFFAYQLGILIDGQQVNIVPLVVDLLARSNRQELENLPKDALLALLLPNGKRLCVTVERIKPLIQLILQFANHIDEEGRLKISPYQFLLLRETELALAASKMRWQGGEALRKQLAVLVDLKTLPQVSVPKGLKTSLRDYQQEGLSWLQFLRLCRFGGVLADDMGLGKTVQTLAHLLVEKEAMRMQKASLIIAPTSLVGNWFEEAARFAPHLKVLIFHGTLRHQDNFDDYDVIISTYGLIQRDKARFVDYPFYYLVLDEAQFIKNARTKTTQIIQQIKAEHRLCLSGTPLENHLGELWSLFHFLMPGLLGDRKQFRTFFKIPIEKEGDKDCQSMLVRRVRPFMLRRTKNQVMKELPLKTEMVRFIELRGLQRDLYEAIRMSMESKVRTAIAKQGLGKSHIVLLDALLKLRQVCCDPALLSLPLAEKARSDSAKKEALMELVDNLMAENRRVLIFSQFTSMLALIEEQLALKAYPYLKLTGQTQNRQQLVKRFQEGKAPIFLISLKAGGTGLNLTEADTVIHYDPWWNPAVEDQATDRAHRIGQEKPVFVYKLITSGTVEEAILSMQNKKRALFQGILSESLSTIEGLSTKDIEQLFAPLD